MMEKENNTVYIVQHVYQFDGREDVKIFGVFSDYAAARQAAEQLLETEMFKGHSDGLHIAAYVLNQIHWQEWEFTEDRREAVINCNNLKMAGHYVAIALEEIENSRTGEIFYAEQTFLLFARDDADAQAQAVRAAEAHYEFFNQVGDLLRRTGHLIEIRPVEDAPKDGRIYSRHFRDKALFQTFLGSTGMQHHCLENATIHGGKHHD